MGKTLRYGEFQFSKGNRVSVKSHTRARTKSKRYQEGGQVSPTDPNEKVFGALNQFRPAGTGPAAVGAGPGALAAHNVNQQGAGYAEPSVRGIAQALGNAMGVLGGTGALQTGVLSMAERAARVEPGTYGGFQNIQGQHPYDAEAKLALAAGMSPDAVQRAQESRRLTAQAQPGRLVGHTGGGEGGQAAGPGRDAFGRAAEHGPADTGEHLGGPRSGYAATGGQVRNLRRGKTGRVKR